MKIKEVIAQRPYFKIQIFVTYVLLRKRVNKLWKDFIRDDGLSELIRVVGESSEGQSSRLLDGRNVIKKKWSQQSHDTYNREKRLESLKIPRILTSTLKGLDVLWSLGQLSDGLYEGDSGLLVSLKWGKDSSGHI